MKKIYLFILLLVFIAGSQVFATVVTERKINKPQTKTNQTTKTNTTSKTQTTSQNRLANNIKTCKPYSESMTADYMGMNLSYKVIIAGWINNKCRLDFNAQTGGASSSFNKTYGINPSDATILSFAPKIRCEFTKQQLDYVGDSILQENARNAGATNNMLKNPNNISINSISAGDQKLFDVVLNQNACTILNSGDLNNLMNQLMQF